MNRGRNQGGRNGRRGSSGKQVQQQPLTATKQVDSNGPAGKIRGNVKQLYDKYKALAHDHRTKDRTSSEAYGQYAHHYYTLYSEFAAAEAAKEIEREQEKERKRQEAAENQSNIVPILDGEDSVSEILHTVEGNDDTQIKPEKHKKSKKSNPKKKRVENAPELPLDVVVDVADAEKPKRTRKPRKVKEDVVQ